VRGIGSLRQLRRSASQETYNERITDGSQSSLRDFGFQGEFGSLYIDDFDFEGNVVDLDVQMMANGSITNSVSEGAQEFLYYIGQNQQFHVDSDRIAPQPGPDGYFMTARGPVLFENNHVEGDTMGVANIASCPGYQQELVLIGNSFAYALAGGNGTPYPATPSGAPITDCGGGSRLGGPYVEIGDVVGALTTNVMVPLSIVGTTASNAAAQQVTLTNGIIQNFADTSPLANYKPSVASCGTSATATGSNFTPVITVGSTNPTTSCALTFNQSGVYPLADLHVSGCNEGNLDGAIVTRIDGPHADRTERRDRHSWRYNQWHLRRELGSWASLSSTGSGGGMPAGNGGNATLACRRVRRVSCSAIFIKLRIVLARGTSQSIGRRGE